MKRIPLFSILLILLILIVPLASGMGAADFGFSQTAKALWGLAFPGKWDVPENVKLILFSVRLPRVVLAGLVGAALGMAGAVFQAIFRNPLAEPYLLGISSGAALGAAAAISLTGGAFAFAVPILAGGIWLTTVFAFLGALLTGVLVFLIAGNSRGDFSVLLLGGIAMSYLLQGVVSLLMMFNRATMERIVFWMMGSFSSATWEKVLPGGLLLLFAGFYFILESRTLNLLSLGSLDAHSLGINPRLRGSLLLGGASLLTAGMVSFAGIIGFAGLLVPHLVRLITGPDHRRVLPCSALLGAELMILADACARTILAPREIPVGVITAFLGVPFFLFLLKRKGREVE